MKKLTTALKNVKSALRSFYTRLLKVIGQRPFASFIAFLVILFALVFVGNLLRKPEAAPAEAEAAPTNVTVFRQDEQPVMEFTAKVEKAGVITIVAQAPGIVRQINVTEGKAVGQGTSVVSLASNYQGSSLPSLARQIAERNTKFNEETYDTQKDIISKQRDLAGKAETQASEMRDITDKSLDDTRGLIALNEDIFNTLDQQINNLQATNVGGANDAAILGAKQGKAAVAAGLNNLRTGLRTAEYQVDGEHTPAKTAEEVRDLTFRQLDLQEKSLDLNKDLSALNLKIARVTEQAMFPASPCTGVVERVYVKVGDAVNPGTPIATIRANKTQANAIVSVPFEIARQINQLEPSTFILNGKETNVFPRYVSTEATEGSLYGIFYTLPVELGDQVTKDSSIKVRVPVGTKKAASQDVIAPIDAIYQTADKAYVYVVQTATQSAEAGQSGQAAELREVQLGDVTGEYVRVNSGLQPNDQVITTRGITNGQRVLVK